jgi:hypothetical protein
MPEMSFSLFPPPKPGPVLYVMSHFYYIVSTLGQQWHTEQYIHTHTHTHTHTCPFSNSYKYVSLHVYKKLPVHGMKAYRGSRGIVSLILNFSTRWR